jgi:hypothetical protein
MWHWLHTSVGYLTLGIGSSPAFRLAGVESQGHEANINGEDAGGALDMSPATSS